MNSLHYSRLRIIPGYRLIVLVLAVSAILMGLVIFLHLSKEIPIGNLTRDVTSIADLPAYTGFLSQVGIIIWSVTATICFFSVTVLSGHKKHHKLRSFLLISGLLTVVLGIDDAFLFHETVLPYFGVPQIVILSGYALFMLVYLFRFHAIILETGCALLVNALFFFGVSVLFDQLYFPVMNPLFFEDGAKLIGLMSWLAYFYRVGQYSVYLGGVE